MSGFKFVIAGLGALALVACTTTPAPTDTPATGSGTAPTGAQPTPPANQDGSSTPQS
jgi:hypothetical protein